MSNFDLELERFIKMLRDFGPGALKFVIAVLKMFPENTQAFKLGVALEKLLGTL